MEDEYKEKSDRGSPWPIDPKKVERKWDISPCEGQAQKKTEHIEEGRADEGTGPHAEKKKAWRKVWHNQTHQTRDKG